MQGLGLFACRRDAWPGLNPRFRGFGGEEGYLHEKVRQAGGRVLCHPDLRWAHRFTRPSGPPYRPTWEDRVRNYRLGWGEIGWDVTPMEDHFREHIGRHPRGRSRGHPGPDRAARWPTRSPTSTPSSPSTSTTPPSAGRQLEHRLRGARHRLAGRAVPGGGHPRQPPPGLHPVVAGHDRRGRPPGLPARAGPRGRRRLPGRHPGRAGRRPAPSWPTRTWDLCFLGACVHAQEFPPADGLPVAPDVRAGDLHPRPGRAPAGLRPHPGRHPRPGPDDGAARRLDKWLDQWSAIDQYLEPPDLADGTFRALITTPRVATQPALRTYADADLALADRYVI